MYVGKCSYFKYFVNGCVSYVMDGQCYEHYIVCINYIYICIFLRVFLVYMYVVIYIYVCMLVIKDKSFSILLGS